MPRLDDERTGKPLPAIPGTPPDPAALPTGCAFHPRCAFAEDTCTREAPALLQIGAAGQTAACFVAQAGVDVSSAGVRETAHAVDAAPVRQTAPATAEPVLEIRDVTVDVGSRRRGLFRREPRCTPSTR